MSEKCDGWIRSLCPGKTFADIGGLWGITGEKVTLAAKSGAARLTMVDHVPGDHQLWKDFHLRASGNIVNDIIADVEDADFQRFFLSRSDIVHCNGLLYHSANPVHFLQQLASVVGEYLILGSLHSGRYEFAKPYGSIFVPNHHKASAISRDFEFPSDAPAYGLSVPETEWILTNGRPNARSFWWLHSKAVIARMLDVVGFRIEDEEDDWDGRVVKFLCRRKS